MSKKNSRSSSSMKTIRVPFQADNKTEEVMVEVPDSGEADEALASEAREYLETLAQNGELEIEDGEMGGKYRPKFPTHQLARNPDGTRTLKRLRFSTA